MKFIAALAFATGAVASYGYKNETVTPTYPIVSYVTSVVPTYETYCSEPTTITYGTKTYEVTTPGTYTITDCPITYTAPVYSTPTTICSSTYVPPVTTATGSYYPTTTPVVAGAGKVGAGAGLAVVAAVVALL